MYCSKCGARVSGSACGNCGTPVTPADYCGGFWGLVGETPPVSAGDGSRQYRPASEMPGDVGRDDPPARTGRSALNLPALWAGAAALVLLVLLLLTAGRLRQALAQTDALEAQYTAAERSLTEALNQREAEVDRLEAEVDRLRQTLEQSGADADPEQEPSEAGEAGPLLPRSGIQFPFAFAYGYGRDTTSFEDAFQSEGGGGRP